MDEACAYPESIGQVDGAQDSPLERLGSRVEVEGRLEVGKESMTGWSQVQRKKGQVEMDVVAVSRGWEEYKRTFPHLAHEQRQMRASKWREVASVKCWLKDGVGVLLGDKERRKERQASEAQKREVETWLRGGGGQK